MRLKIKAGEISLVSGMPVGKMVFTMTCQIYIHIKMIFCVKAENGKSRIDLLNLRCKEI